MTHLKANISTLMKKNLLRSLICECNDLFTKYSIQKNELSLFRNVLDDVCDIHLLQFFYYKPLSTNPLCLIDKNIKISFEPYTAGVSILFLHGPKNLPQNCSKGYFYILNKKPWFYEEK